MENEKQLLLFFKKGLTLDATLLAAKLKSKFDILGDPTVIPYSANNPGEPLVVFDRGEINLTVTISDVSFIYHTDKEKEIFDIIIEIIECLEELDYSFVRMGYVSTYVHSKKEREFFKEKMFKDPKMIDSEFQLSWYKKELIDSVSVNVWEREMTDIMNGVELVSMYDINTPIDEVYNISSDFVKDFLKACDKYIAVRDKKNK